MTFNPFIEPPTGYVNLSFVLDTQVLSLNLYLSDSVNEAKIVNYSILVALVLRPFVLHLFVLTPLEFTPLLNLGSVVFGLTLFG
jgi:hypothetical protein